MPSGFEAEDKLWLKAKRYSAIKYGLEITAVVYLLVILFVFGLSGLSCRLADKISSLVTARYLVIAVYLLIVSLAYSLLAFPLNFYQSFRLEHRFGLSGQKIGDWLLDQLKAAIIGYIISLILLETFYYIFARYPHYWWLVISLFWIFFSLILAKLLPVLIIPLFFKSQPLLDTALRERIIQLAREMQVRILDVFQIDFSKKSFKANAALVGWGLTRRVLLADTLKDKYSYDEIEVILAHEFAHYRLRHLVKLILINSSVTVFLFYIIFKTSSFTLGLFGLSSLSDIAAFPVLMIYLVLFGIIMQPLVNFISRRFEKNADKLALKITGLKDAFISMMDKLAAQNLADRNPHPIIKFFFFDHPPVDERIQMANNF